MGDLFGLLWLHRLYYWFFKRLYASSFSNWRLVNYLRITRCSYNKLVDHLTFFTRLLFFVRFYSYHDFLLSFLALTLKWVYLPRGTEFTFLAHLCRQIYSLLLYHVSNYVLTTCISELFYGRLLLSPYIIYMRVVLQSGISLLCLL